MLTSDEKNLPFVNCAIDMSWKITDVKIVKIYILFHEKHQTASDVRRILCDANCYCCREIYMISLETSSTTMNILINLIRWNRMPARPATAVWVSYHWMMFTAADRPFKNTPIIFKVLIWCSSLAILVNFLIYMGSMKPAFHWNIEITVHDKKGKLISNKNNIFVEMIFCNIK